MPVLGIILPFSSIFFQPIHKIFSYVFFFRFLPSIFFPAVSSKNLPFI